MDAPSQGFAGEGELLSDGRSGTGEIADLAVYIASEDARSLTGQAIVLDGGQVMP